MHLWEKVLNIANESIEKSKVHEEILSCQLHIAGEKANRQKSGFPNNLYYVLPFPAHLANEVIRLANTES